MPPVQRAGVSDEAADDVCPGCGLPVVDGEDYVVAQEYTLDQDFGLHLDRGQGGDGIERRFHVGHFRGRMGDCFYELVPRDRPYPSQ